MTTEVIFPRQSEAHDESLITFWHVSEGDFVNKGDTLVEVQTEKAVTEIEAPISGIVQTILKKRATTVKVGELLAIITASQSTEPCNVVNEVTPTVMIKATPLVKKLAKDLGVDWTQIMPSNSNGVISSDDVHRYHAELGKLQDEEVNKYEVGQMPRILARPSVRKFARENNVDLEQIKTADGHVTKEDVLNYINQSEQELVKKVEANTPASYNTKKREPISATRKAIVKAVTHSHTMIPQVTHFDEVNVSKLIESRNNIKPYCEKQQLKLTYLAYVVKAYTLTLKQFPLLNASFDAAANEIVYNEEYNIGIAVNSEEGLFVPVIKNTNKKSLLQVAGEIEQLTAKAREGHLQASEMSEGTSTISNIGSVQGSFFTPIIHAPQATILGIGAITKKVAVENEELSILPVMPLSLSYDHRIIDGVLAQQALNELKVFIQNPDWLLANDGV